MNREQGLVGPPARRALRRNSARLRAARFGVASACALALVASAGCGKKGPPLAPLIIMPSAVADVSASRSGDRVLVRFTPPAKNTDNSAPADVARVEVYAMSVASAASAPNAAELARDGTRVGSVDLKGTAPTSAEEPAGPQVFTETLTPRSFQVVERDSTGSTGSTGSTRSTRSAAAGNTSLIEVLSALPGLETLAAVPVRVYGLVPVSGRGRRGPASVAMVSLAPAPAAPSAPALTYTETAISLAWLTVEEAEGYNVYDRGSTGSAGPAGSTGPASSTDAPAVPLNASPLDEPSFEDKRIDFGKSRCYRITAVKAIEQRRIESLPSEPACVTPIDTFAPAAPTAVAAVAGPGSISLIWDAVSARDLAGYLVLRGEAPGDRLQALTPEPIKETTFRDAAITPGLRYVYVVVAVDASKNMSAHSARVEEMAR